MRKPIYSSILNRLCPRPPRAYELKLNEPLRSNGNAGRIMMGVDLYHSECIFIGEHIYANGDVLDVSENARIVVDEDCTLSHCVHLRTDMHRRDYIDLSMDQQGHDEASVVSRDDVLVGYGTQIMSGVTVGSHAIADAGVAHGMPAYVVGGGACSIAPYAGGK